MKFAKELEQEAVPEWRVKYLNYKAGKKAIKAVSRAISRATTTPTLGRRTADPLPQHTTPASLFTGGPRSTHARSANGSPPAAVPENDPLQVSPRSVRRTPVPATHALTRAATVGNERSGLARSPESGMRYGAFVPPAGSSPSYASDRVDFELPAPAIRVPSRTSDNAAAHSPSLSRMALQRSASMTAAMPAGLRSPSTLNLPPGGVPVTPRMTPRLRLHRIFSSSSQLSRRSFSKLDIGMQNLDQVRSTERDFFHFLNGELDKIETFYKQKEDQASERLIVLREQLHEMRNRRTEEIAEAKRKREMERNSSPSDDDTGGEGAKNGTHDWISPIKAKFLKPGPNTKALLKMNRTPVMTGQTGEARRDYVRRPHSNDVPYRTAKRKLKLALQEFYRGLELLKSYALLNRTAFRKLNKKYDKAINARPPYRYMNEKVNKSWFVNSDILDGHIRTVEDLYARYFERGNRKIAAGKLRNLSKRRGNSSGSAFRSGLLIGIGCVFAIQGLIYGSELLLDNESGLSDHTSYLMQLYGGYFLMLLLFIFFTLACRIWTRNKINYPFIFEFDPRNNLDWTQLAEFPSFFFALFGVFIWLNFSRFGNTWETMYLYYPVILIGLSLAILFFPAPIIHYKARRWFVYSHYRLFFAGLYPVEFRDFFLGDIWCSLTYATCNIELFFCLYARSWNDPTQCNSSHSRLLGFFGALPPIWRALQCIRRYRDTGNVFPHLVNCGKYGMTILAAVCLSLYRIDGTQLNMSFFIAFGAINAIYCSIWDIFMDFSLLQANARHPFLRDITALRPVWVYYFIMIVDPILRFSWIFYAIFTHNTQHNTIVSFLISFAEVTRRGMWTVLRVENEHCGNVAQYKASRDTPLPYHLGSFVERPSLEAAAETVQGEHTSTKSHAISTHATGVDIPGSGRIRPGTAISTTIADEALPEEGATFRRRYTDTGKKSILRVMAEAHKQDFEKKRPAEEVKGKDLVEEEDELRSEEDDDEDEDSRSLQEVRMQIREADTLMRQGRSDDDDDDDDDEDDK